MIHLPSMPIDFHNFFHAGLWFVLKCAQVMYNHEERLIPVINEDHRSSLMSGGMRCNFIRRKIFLKIFNLNCRSEEL